MLDAPPNHGKVNAAADTQGTPQSTPAPGRPGSLPFTPYGGTTAPYAPKAGSPSKGSKAKTFSCALCKASGFGTRTELDAHVKSEHPTSGGAAAAGAPGHVR